MQQFPQGDALLECARNLFRDRLLPTMAADQKHSALMIMNAMAIAARQFRSIQTCELDERTSLQEFFMEDCGTLLAANQLLARLIREGGGDPGQPQREKILAHLRKVGRQRLAESNPKVLNFDGG
jgi:hypothetical protein